MTKLNASSRIPRALVAWGIESLEIEESFDSEKSDPRIYFLRRCEVSARILAQFTDADSTVMPGFLRKHLEGVIVQTPLLLMISRGPWEDLSEADRGMVIALTGAKLNRVGRKTDKSRLTEFPEYLKLRGAGNSKTEAARILYKSSPRPPGLREQTFFKSMTRYEDCYRKGSLTERLD